MKCRPNGWLVICILIIVVSAACAPDPDTPPAGEERTISSGSSFGQSFTALYGGLSGVDILLAPANSYGEGSLFFHLRESSESKHDLANTQFPLSEISQIQYYRFSFPAQRDSQYRDYFIQVDVEGEGRVQILTNQAETYLDGSLYENQVPQEAQLDFRLAYDRLPAISGVLSQLIKWAGVLGIGIFAFLIPGWAVFSLLWRNWDEQNWGVKLGLAGGLSLAIYPLLILWTNLVGLYLGDVYAWLPSIIGLIALGWKYREIIIYLPERLRRRSDQNTAKSCIWHNFKLADLAAILVIALLIISRFWVVRSVDVPLFGDSLQHTMITQLMIDHDGLFDSWEPYARLSSFTYHFGFHSLAAVFHWISGASSARSVLWTGQLVNILAILSLYPLAYRITPRKWAGVIAMLVGGLLIPYPMSYVNWGRYTQLAGQAILPVVVWVAWSLLEKPYQAAQKISVLRRLVVWRYLGLDIGGLFIAWLALGGTALTHYRVLILSILFIAVFSIISVWRANFLKLSGRVFWLGIGGAALFLPWFIHVYGGKLMNIFSTQITTQPTQPTSGSIILDTFTSLRTYLPDGIWILLILCLAWGIWKRKKELFIFTLWWLLIILAANPNWVGLPGADVINNFAVFIAFYFPATIIAGTAAEWISWNRPQTAGQAATVPESHQLMRMASIVSLLIIFGVGVWALPQRIRDLNLPSYALITRPDLRAMAWIRQATPIDATFLINSFFAYNNTLVAGSDGGWWLPLLTGRRTSLPPLTYGFEEGSGDTNIAVTNDLSRQIQAKGITSQEAISLLQERGIGYIYIGQRQGRVNYNGPHVLDPQVISQDPDFEMIYHQDRVWIFKIVP